MMSIVKKTNFQTQFLELHNKMFTFALFVLFIVV